MLDIQPQQAQANQSSTKPIRTGDVKAVGSKEGLSVASIFIVLGTVLVIVFAGLLFILRSSVEAQNKKKLESVQVLKSELEKPAYKELETKLGDVKSQIAAFEAAQKQVDPTKVIDHLKKITPKYIKYTSFSVDSANEIKLEGYTSSYYNLAKYLVAVRKDKQLSNTKLGSMSMSTKEGGSIEIRFSFTAKYLGEAVQTKQAPSSQNTEPAIFNDVEGL